MTGEAGVGPGGPDARSAAIELLEALGIAEGAIVGVLCWPSVHVAGAFCTGLTPERTEGLVTEMDGPYTIKKIDNEPAWAPTTTANMTGIYADWWADPDRRAGFKFVGDAAWMQIERAYGTLSIMSMSLQRGRISKMRALPPDAAKRP